MTDQSLHDDWETRYQTGQTGWDRGQTSPALHRWLNTGDLKPGRILIPGCGRGYEVIELALLGFGVTAIDIASSAIEWLEQKLSEEKTSARVMQVDLLKWETEKPFDAIYEQTCLCALNPKQWNAYEQKLHQWLKPRGKVFTLFMQTHQEGGPPFHCDMGEMKQLFPESRWNWNNRSGKRIPHPSGREELAFILEKI